jgi:type I restriction-modification system DNA methylase subunit
MYLTEEHKAAIKLEFNSFVHSMYAGKSKEERQQLDQFFTPAELTIEILEALDCTYEEFLDSDVIDPTSGSGNLLAAALIIGVDPSRVFGNEYDVTMVELCRKRLQSINSNVRDWQVHQGNALITDCLTKFGPEYDDTILKELLKRRNGLKGGWMDNPDKYKALGEPEPIDLFGGFFND